VVRELWGTAMKRGKGWTIFFPRFHCPHCGKELTVSFNGRWKLPRPKRTKEAQEALVVKERRDI